MNPLLRPILRILVAAATLSVASLSVHAQAVTGDVQAGAKRATMCIACHGSVGYQSSFPEVHRVPKISGQSEQALVVALTAYKTGARRHPTMRGIAAALSEQDIANLAAYYASHRRQAAAPAVPREPSVAVAALLERGACVACHGANFSTPIDPSYPKIGGQYADYLFVALRAYTVEGNRLIGRTNPVMAGISRLFTPAEMRQLASYLESVEGELKVVPQAAFR